MSAELFDLRAKVTPLGHCAMAAYCRANQIDKSELVRDIIEEWAKKQVHGATLLHSCLKAQGVTAADAGIAGNSLNWDEQ